LKWPTHPEEDEVEVPEDWNALVKEKDGNSEYDSEYMEDHDGDKPTEDAVPL
jgi:hypothetical protein